jgi:hypothetical protein
MGAVLRTQAIHWAEEPHTINGAGISADNVILMPAFSTSIFKETLGNSGVSQGLNIVSSATADLASMLS